MHQQDQAAPRDARAQIAPQIRPQRVAFAGSPHFAVPALEALIGAKPLVEVVAVITQPDRPAGRRRILQPPPIKAVASRHGLPLFQWRRLRDGAAHAALSALELDLLIVAAYGRILPQSLLDCPRLGCVNLHASLLPAWRGASPIQRAIWHGDTETGITLMQMDAGLDTGPIWAQRALPVTETDTGHSLSDKLGALSATLLIDCLPVLVEGKLTPTPQPTDGVSVAPLLTKEDGALHFAHAAAALARQIRALTPWPGCYFSLAAERVAVLSAKALQPRAIDEGSVKRAPGTILDIDADAVIVACGQGALAIERVKPAGRQEMAANAWIAGRRLQKGATLGALPADEGATGQSRRSC